MDTPERFTHLVDQYDAWQRETIRRHGWALQAVLGDEQGPPFVYTVGLSGFAHPELILFATSQATAATVLNALGELVRSGRRLHAGDLVELPGRPSRGRGRHSRGRNGGAVHLLEFPESEAWLLAANDLYRMPDRPPVPALVVIPDDDLAVTPGDDHKCVFC